MYATDFHKYQIIFFNTLKGAMVKGGCFLALKHEKPPEIKGFKIFSEVLATPK
jgi:hypothetical protein